MKGWSRSIITFIIYCSSIEIKSIPDLAKYEDESHDYHYCDLGNRRHF